jgi:spore maturation protein SpmA
VLNAIWAAFFLAAFLAGLHQWLVLGNSQVWAQMVASAFDMAKTAFEVSLGLTGVMCLWLGFMKLGERGGAVTFLGRAVDPLFRRLFPGIPAGHPAGPAIVMNMSANMLGLDNAATPLGLKAMKELQELNPEKDTATDDMILFLVINTSAVTVIPVAIMTYRAQLGAKDPTDVFLPLLIATYCSSLAGLLVTAWVQKLRLRDPVVVAYVGALTALVGGIVAWASRLDRATLEAHAGFFSNFVIFGLILSFVALAAWRRVPVYEAFVEGAKEGFQVAVGIIPYLVAMLVAIGILRASGALDRVLDVVRWAVTGLGLDTRWVDALPVGLVRPLSGSGSRGLVIETMKTFGADSFAGRLACVIQGSTETTFYILTVYFGSVGIRKWRHAVPCGLAAELVGFVAAVMVSYLFFG